MDLDDYDGEVLSRVEGEIKRALEDGGRTIPVAIFTIKYKDSSRSHFLFADAYLKDDSKLREAYLKLKEAAVPSVRSLMKKSSFPKASAARRKN